MRDVAIAGADALQHRTALSPTIPTDRPDRPDRRGMRFAMAAMAVSIKELPPLAAGHSRLYLCRHGETDSNANGLLQGSGVDAILNDVGRSQASLLAETLASIKMDVVASSTLKRAMETADIVSAMQPGGVERARHKGLEEMFYGRLEGLPIAETRAELRELSEAWEAGQTDVAVGGDGESPEALLSRAHAALWGTDESLLGLQHEAGRHLTVIAHSTFNKAVLAAATGEGLEQMFGIPQDNCCVNVLDVAVARGGGGNQQPVTSVSVVALNLAPSGEKKEESQDR